LHAVLTGKIILYYKKYGQKKLTGESMKAQYNVRWSRSGLTGLVGILPFYEYAYLIGLKKQKKENHWLYKL
jgi:hypothetical protein